MRIEELKKELELKQKKTARKYLLAIIVVGIIVGGLSGVTAYSFSAKQVSFTPSNKAWKVNNVNDAIESLQLSKTSTNYSTDEQVIGTWIDGKSLYQKTIITSLPITTVEGTNASADYDISSSNADVLFIRNVDIYSSNYSINGSVFNNRDVMDNAIVYQTQVYRNHSTSSDLIHISNSKVSWSNRTLYITIQYTKTTDTATTS